MSLDFNKEVTHSSFDFVSSFRSHCWLWTDGTWSEWDGEEEEEEGLWRVGMMLYKTFKFKFVCSDIFLKSITLNVGIIVDASPPYINL